MKFRIILAGCMLAFTWGSLRGQALVNGTPVRPCATMEQDSINRLKYPQVPTLDDFERAIQRKVNELISMRTGGIQTQSVVVTIPVIVHVIHNGEAEGTGMNISQAQIQSQIDVLNEDYRKKPGTPGFNSNPVGADIEIEFCLSPVDQNGNTMTEPGIDRRNGGKTSWTRSDIEGSLKPTTIWNPNLFYNVWTLKFGGADANLLGYAQFPDQSGLAGLSDNGGPSSTDGVVVQYSSFGSSDKGSFPVLQAPYNKGRTLSHETGHWLGGLRHIWGDGTCGDDFVSDTPTQQGPSNGTCPNVAACSGPLPAMVQNYMDYSNDACMNIFTAGQKLRFQAVMQLSPRRGSLVAANLCSPVVADVPTPNFTTDQLQCVLLGSQLTFTDLSTNFPTEWHWTFEGGDPASSTERNPKVQYNTPGSFKVSLWAKNAIGTSDTLVQNNYIVVSDLGLCSSFNNFLPAYTPSVLKLSQFGAYTGYLTGHNSAQSSGVSEFFTNDCGYKFVSGVKIRFGKIHPTSEDASVTVILWNARGPQHAPGSVIERKVVLLKQIQDDLANNQPTTIVFDRESPVFSMPFQVGIELDYATGDSVAVQSSANGEANNASSWIRDPAGVWKPYAIAFGANIAMNIEPIVGMNPSVQVSASKQLIYSGEEVVLNGQGASIFEWDAEDGTVKNYLGPQLIAHPAVTTTYMTIGSGLELCNDTTYTTIYIRENVTGISHDNAESSISLFPNPGTSQLNIVIQNNFRGLASVQMWSVVGSEVTQPGVSQKSEDKLIKTIDTSFLRPGVYLVVLKLGDQTITRKWVKY